MGVHNTRQEGKVAMFDSVTGRAFGPVFDHSQELDDFLDWAADHAPDPRTLSDKDLDYAIDSWREARAANTDPERTPA